MQYGLLGKVTSSIGLDHPRDEFPVLFRVTRTSAPQTNVSVRYIEQSCVKPGESTKMIRQFTVL